MGPSFLTALAWRYRLTLSYGHGFQSFFSKKEFFISGFFPGGDVVAGNLFLEYTHICTLKILSHCTTSCNIEHVFTCLINLYLRLLITRLDWYCKIVLLFDL